MNKEVIKRLREMFKTPGSRANLLTLMIEEIRYEKMKEKNHGISYAEAIKELREEFDDIAYVIETRERNKIVGDFMKDMGF
jgi:hypothetical protein